MTTINETIIAGLRRKKANADILLIVRQKHPKATTGLDTVNWWRCRLRESGENIPSEQEAKRA